MTISYCTKCGKESCQHGGWTSRSDEALMRRAPAALEEQGGPCSRCGGWHLWCTGNYGEVRLTIAALDPLSKIPELKVCAVRIEKIP